MERKGLLYYSQELATGLYPEPDETIWHPRMLGITTWISVIKKLLGGRPSSVRNYPDCMQS
jgi:hypothetical protein